MKNINMAHIEAKRKLYKLSAQERVNCILFVHSSIKVITELPLLIRFASNRNPTTAPLIFRHASALSVSQYAEIIIYSLEFCDPNVAGIA